MPILYELREPPPHVVMVVRGVVDTASWLVSIQQVLLDPRIRGATPIILNAQDVFVAANLGDTAGVVGACRLLTRLHPLLIVAPPGASYLAARQIMQMAPEITVVPTVEEAWAWLSAERA